MIEIPLCPVCSCKLGTPHEPTCSAGREIDEGLKRTLEECRVKKSYASVSEMVDDVSDQEFTKAYREHRETAHYTLAANVRVVADQLKLLAMEAEGVAMSLALKSLGDKLRAYVNEATTE